MVRVLKFLEPIRNSLLSIKNRLCCNKKFEYMTFSRQDENNSKKELNELGKEGWKLISGSFNSNKERYTFWLQREVKE